MNTTHVWTDPQRCSGKPCVRGTRYPIAQLLAELVEGRSIGELAEDIDVPLEALEAALEDVADFFGKSYSKVLVR